MTYRLIAIVALAALLGSCASDPTRGKTKALDDALNGYAATIRWGDIEQAEAFIDPEVRAAHPLGSIERSRYRQVRIAGYSAQAVQRITENELQQNVVIELINENTQGVRSFMDRQTWRYDDKAQRWWLTSGLPDISPRE